MEPKSSLDGQSCATILRRMVNLKKKWRDRADFFKFYSKLREMLYLTPEYKNFLAEVRAKSVGMCVRSACSKRGRHVHHKVRVYADPLQAVDVSNGEYLCVGCHKKEHADGSGRVRAVFKKKKIKKFN